MTKEYCDICVTDVKGFDLKDFFGGREYRIVERRTCDELDDIQSLTLCRICAQRLTYFMRNRAELENRVSTMNLRNRVRYLFLRPLKTENRGQRHA